MKTERIFRSSILLQLVQLWVFAVLVPSSVAWALTAANTLIKNQASASFKDETGQQYSVTSNMVETLVQQVAGVDLVQDQSKRASIGGEVYFPHVLTNVGNGDDQYSLSWLDIGSGDDFNFGSGNVSFYADTDQDGQPDDLNVPITITPLLAPDENFAFVAVATVPGSATDGDSGQLTLEAYSQFDNTITDSNVDTADVTTQAIVDVTKALSVTTGAAGSGSYTVTLSYANISAMDATDLVIIDALPAGMSYVAGSGRWSASGTTAMTDSNPTDTETVDGETITWCAYDASCSGLPEASQDADSDSTNQVTATVSRVGAGLRGSISFEVTIDAGLPVSQLTNVAEQEYNDGSSTVSRTPTNRVIFSIVASPGVVTNGSSTVDTDLTDEPITVASIPQGGTASFTDYVWNTGNGDDSFDLALSASTFPAGTAIQLFKADGVTPLIDTDGNGLPDTGMLTAGASTAVVIKATLPPNASGSNYEVTLTATSLTDSSLSNPARNVLSSIATASADLTNNAALGGSGVLGAGAGPEPAALTTNTALPGETTRFTLYANNIGGGYDNYSLSASTDSSFAALTLPTNWAVNFVDANGNTLNNTGSIAPGDSKVIYADISLPAGENVSTTSIYFRMVSLNTGASDIKHDAVSIDELTDLVLTPDNQGQVLPGSTIIYTHRLVNQGNATKTAIDLTHSNNKAADGWASDIYADTDNDGVLSTGDTRLTNVASLAAGDSVLIFTKVYAPANVPMGTENTTTLTASWDSGASSTSAEDLTTTNRTDIQIVKKQALDNDCNGSPDAAFSLDSFAAEPGECVIYQLMAVNTGAETMQNVRIQDATPAYTHFITAGGLPILSQGALVAPVSDGGTGQVIGDMGSLPAGDSATLIFGIEIE